MWIVFGTGVKTTRVPGGAKVERRCGQCSEVATFYEKEVTATFRLYFVDVFDYRRHRVMACGCCGACYATDELGVPAAQAPADASTRSLGDGLDRVGGALGRAAGALGAGISSLFSDDDATSPAASREEDEAEEPSKDDLDAMEDPLEARFRELERKAGLRPK
jgi:hypothetical protein